MASALHRAARWYQEHGFGVFPLHSPDGGGCSCRKPGGCDSPAKHPRTLNGLKDATKDAAQIDRWWEMWPAANVGIATGPISGVVVLDIDPRHGGYDSLSALISKFGNLPDTAEVITGSQGLHYYYAAPSAPIGNSAGKLGPGLDVRGAGGYVVAPPSLHMCGGTYLWEHSGHIKNVRPAPMPEWMVDLLAKPAGAVAGHTPEEWAQLAGGVGEGARNDTLASVAGAAFRCLPSPTLAFEMTLSWAHEHLEPVPSEEELIRTINSIANKEASRRKGLSHHG